MAARGKSTRGSGGRKTEATPEHPPLELVVGFDAEWVNANRADDSLPTSDNVLISWQLAVVLPNGKLLSRIFYAEGDTRRHRLSLIKMLSKALFDAWQNGDIKALPPAWRITIAGHFLRADLTTVREFPKLKTRVDSVRKTFTTVTKPVVATVLGRKATIYFADTLLLSPQGSSLKKLGEVIGRPKVELRDGAIERMDLLRKNDPALFEKYAVEDAIIAALYYLKISEILKHELGVEDRVATLGGAGVHMIKVALGELGLAPERYFGCERREGARHWLSCLAEIRPFAANCYHGARNEAYRIGFTPTGTRLYDLDLRGAYTTAMALMRVPDWESAHATTDIEQLAVIGEAMTFAWVRFEFPADTRYPSLPARAAWFIHCAACRGVGELNSSSRSLKARRSRLTLVGGSNGSLTRHAHSKPSRDELTTFASTPRRRETRCSTKPLRRSAIPPTARSPRRSTRCGLFTTAAWTASAAKGFSIRGRSR